MLLTDGTFRLVRFFLTAILVVIFVTESTVALANVEEHSLREQLRRRIEAAGVPPEITIGDEIVYASVALPLFYERRAFEPAWVGANGPLPAAAELLAAILSAEREGLRSDDYHAKTLKSLHSHARNVLSGPYGSQTGRLVDLELLCTDAFLILGSHFLSGRVNPQTIDAEWFANRREADLASVLEKAIEKNSVDSVLHSLLPPQTGYRLLRKALADYRAIERSGGWGKISDGPAMKSGETDSRVVNLRKRLIATGDLAAATDQTSAVFDGELKEAVMAFQRRHGLEADGVVGAETLAALNVSVRERISQLIINLERWRWLPQDLGYRHVLVNIADFELDVVENNEKVISMRVIVGKSYRRTPVFSDRITYLVFNPYWNVPHILAVNDILPLLRDNPNYVAENDFEVLQGWGEEAQVIDPSTVDWSSVNRKQFPYRFRQKPGPKNALGRIKFMFPNQFNVYLHDTPMRGLFAKAKRDFSSGCIRVERPLELAEYLLQNSQRWNPSTLQVQLEKGSEQTVRLPEPVPVHILYWTARVDAAGAAHFRRDIYERDRALLEALNEEPPDSN